jgi:hypothetical protein
LSAAGPMIGSIQGAMRTRRLLIGPALLNLAGRGFFVRYAGAADAIARADDQGKRQCNWRQSDWRRRWPAQRHSRWEVVAVVPVVADPPTPVAHQPPQRLPAPGTAFASLTGAARRFAVKRYAAAASRSRARITVIAVHGLPVGVATLRSGQRSRSSGSSGCIYNRRNRLGGRESRRRAVLQR